jgi:hypothetical protein
MVFSVHYSLVASEQEQEQGDTPGTAADCNRYIDKMYFVVNLCIHSNRLASKSFSMMLFLDNRILIIPNPMPIDRMDMTRLGDWIV